MNTPQHTYQLLRTQALRCADPREKWQLLRAAHIVGQSDLSTHWDSHLQMLHLAWTTRNGREIQGQLIRLSLVPLGHLLGRLPLGNPGTSDVNAFAPMAVPSELLERIVRASEEPSRRGSTHEDR